MNKLIQIVQHDKFMEVAFNRPKTLNAFDIKMISELATVLTRLAVDNSVKGIALTGRGQAFCTGGDLKWAVDFSDKPGSSFYELATQLHIAVLEIRQMNKPVVAAINGPAVGAGFTLALACDFRVMEQSAILKQAYTSSGLSIEGGGTYTMPRIVGFARALEIAAFDKPISADDALRLGLTTKVVKEGTALKSAIDMLDDLAKSSLHSFSWSKRLLNESFINGFETHLELEREGLADCADHPDGREGLHAFIEKRKPEFNR